MTPASIAGVCCGALVLASAASLREVVQRRQSQRVAARLQLPAARGVDVRARPVRSPARLAGALGNAGVDVEPDTVATWTVASCLCLSLVGGWFGGAVLAALLPVLAVAGGSGALVALRGRGDRRYVASLPLGLELVARSLRTGASLPQALGEAGRDTPGPVGADFATIDAERGLGRPLVDAVEAWAERRALPSVRLAAAALCLGAETGGAQARAVDGVAATLRERVALHDEVRALTSQARTSALVIAVAPLVFCAATALVDGDSAAFLLRTPLGLVLLVTGLALDAVSAAWMHRLTGRVAS